MEIELERLLQENSILRTFRRPLGRL